MNLSDTKTINASRSVVYAALLDPEVLKQCVPGCEEMIGSPEAGFETVVMQKVGPVKATFKASILLTDMVESERLTISGEGKGGAAGFAKAGAKIHLEDKDGQTELHYVLDAKIGGKLAQLGSRIIGGFAKKIADQFFNNLESVIGTPPEAEPETQDNDTQKKFGWFRKLAKILRWFGKSAKS